MDNLSRQVVFAMQNGGQNIVLNSDASIQPGLWHHIGISWGATELDLYIDGKQVAHRSDVPIVKEWASYGNFVRFGKPTANLQRKGIENFHGWLDEFALWDRPLLPEEVAQQFRAALHASTAGKASRAE